ncbi:MAG: ABC transporter permease [Actinomycetales bacterium]
MSGTFAPAPGAAPFARMVARQASFETKLLLRNGEQFVLALVIPLLVLFGVSEVGVIELGAGRRIDIVTPGVIALAVMSTAFTAQAIGTGFDRRYGVLKRLGASPLPRTGLILGKVLCVLGIEVLQIVVIAAAALAVGWHPTAPLVGALPVLLLGTAAFLGLAMLLAGLLRAEATLAAANLAWLLLLAGGGMVVPLDRLPDGAAAALSWLPSAALTNGLRATLQHGATVPWGPLAILAAWAVVAVALAARTFRWE